MFHISSPTRVELERFPTLSFQLNPGFIYIIDKGLKDKMSKI